MELSTMALKYHSLQCINTECFCCSLMLAFLTCESSCGTSYITIFFISFRFSQQPLCKCIFVRSFFFISFSLTGISFRFTLLRILAIYHSAIPFRPIRPHSIHTRARHSKTIDSSQRKIKLMIACVPFFSFASFEHFSERTFTFGMTSTKTKRWSQHSRHSSKKKNVYSNSNIFSPGIYMQPIDNQTTWEMVREGLRIQYVYLGINWEQRKDMLRKTSEAKNVRKIQAI